MHNFHRVAALLVVALSPLVVQAAETPAAFSGGVLVDAKGMTLYTFDQDVASSGRSACNGPCAALWPPVAASDEDRAMGAFGIVVRDDGTRQWSYKGRPIYSYRADQKPGDRTGDRFRDVWHVVKE